MRSIFATFLTILLAYILSASFHWIAGFLAILVVVPIFNLTGKQAILTAGIGLFLLWSGCATILDLQNDHILSRQIATLFGDLPIWILPISTGLIGGVAGAIVGWFAGLLMGFIHR